MRRKTELVSMMESVKERNVMQSLFFFKEVKRDEIGGLCQYNSVIKKPFHFLKSFGMMTQRRGELGDIDIVRQVERRVVDAKIHKNDEALLLLSLCLHSQAVAEFG